MITKKQIQIIHIAKSKLGLEDEDYRLMLRNIGKVGGEKPSCKGLSQRGFEDVMAFMEKLGAEVSTGDYWQRRQEDRGRFADPRTVYRIGQLAVRQQYDLKAMCRKFSDNRTEHPSKLTPQEAHKLVEMLKSVVNREGESHGREAVSQTEES